MEKNVDRYTLMERYWLDQEGGAEIGFLMLSTKSVCNNE